MSENLEMLQKQLIAAEAENKQLKKEIAEVINLVRRIIGVLGLLDEKTNAIKPELLSGEESPLGLLMEALSGIVALITKSKMPVIGKKYEKELEEKFAFVKDIVPIVEKYATAKL